MEEAKKMSKTVESFLQQGSQDTFSSFEHYADLAKADATASIGDKLRSLIGLAIGLIIPSKPLARAYLLEAKDLATKAEIAETVMAAAALRAGGAIGYGRLSFKLMESGNTEEPSDDRSRILRDREYMTQLRKANPGSFDGLAKFMESLHKPQMALPAKHYELIAVAGATITQCVYCLEKHVNDAKKAGANNREIADVVHMAVILRAKAVMHECEDNELTELLNSF